MALYHNGTRFAAIVTINVSVTSDPKKTLEVGVPSSMNKVGADVGIHDLLVGPGESIQLDEGVEAQFVGVRGAA